MQEWIQKLLTLQEQDLRIALLDEQLHSVPDEKAATASLLRDAEGAVVQAKHKVTEDGKAIKTLEIEIEAVQTHMRDFQSKSIMIKNNDDYKAALHQIDGCKKQIRQFEDRQLVLMEDLDRSRRELDAREKELDAAKRRVAERLADLGTRERNCTTGLAAVRQERAATVAGFPEKMATVLRRYERVRASRRVGDKRAFVPVREGACDCCHMRVTAQMRMDVRKGQAVSCQNCGTLLYVED